jgi:hypothetical protein
MTKAEALAIFTRELVRELLREDEPTPAPAAAPSQPDPGPGWAQPRFDFDPSSDQEFGAQPETCEHGGVLLNRAECPVHGPAAQVAPTAEELDDIASEEVAAPIARARRIAEQREKKRRSERLFPEDLEMRGMAPPVDLDSP